MIQPGTPSCRLRRLGRSLSMRLGAIFLWMDTPLLSNAPKANRLRGAHGSARVRQCAGNSCRTSVHTRTEDHWRFKKQLAYDERARQIEAQVQLGTIRWQGLQQLLCDQFQ